MNFNPDTKEGRRALAKQIAAEGAVLLKNDGELLPFAPGTRIAVFGRTQINTVKGGTGSANCDCEYTVSILDGIREAGLAIDETLAGTYRSWIARHPIPNFGVWGSGMHCAPEMPLDGVIDRVSADAAVVVIGRTAGENEDVMVADGDWYLSEDERTMLSLVTARFPGRVAVLLNSGGMIDLSFADEYGVSALLHAFMPGMEGARAVGEILSGAVTPSGKLTCTVPMHYGDCPSAGHFGQTGGGILQDYMEDVYVGYRYYLTLPGAREKVRYPFGFGLSYTGFRIGGLSLAETDGVVTVTGSVTNTGTSRSGCEVVQVYCSVPEPPDGAKLWKPALVLAGFARTSLLAPGESEPFSVTFALRELASFDDTGATGNRDCFVLEAGEYGVFAGNCSTDLVRVGTCRKNETEVVAACRPLGTSLPERLTGDGHTETLETVPEDPSVGLRIRAEGKTTVGATRFSASDVTPDGERLTLRRGQSVTYRLIAGVSGGYRLRFAGAPQGSGRFSEYGRLLLDGVEQTDFDCVLAEQAGEIVLPSDTSELTLTAVSDFPGISALEFEKTDPVIHIPSEGTTRFPATGFYECAYGLNVRHFRDGGNGTPVSVLSNFWTPGKYAVYKLSVEQAGIYALSIRYANYMETTTLADACALFVSNVGQTLSPVPMIHTCEKEDQLHLLADSEPVRIALPAGECYFKLVSSMWQFPDLESFSLVRTEEASGASLGARAADEDTDAADESTAASSGNYAPSLLAPDEDLTPASVTLFDVADGRRTTEELLAAMSDADLIRLVSGNPRNKNNIGVSGCLCAGLLRYGIPPLQTADGPLGLRVNALTTAYPSGSMLSSSWDPDLAEAFGRAIGSEAKELEQDIWLAPGVNLYRDPCCGRTFEYYAEDPLLASRIAVGVCRGVQENGTSVCVKHFAINNTEHERLKSNSRVSARAIRELYLRVFERILREGDPWCVMSSYNHVNDRKISEQRAFITDIAHGEWGWDGVIMSDWDNDSRHVEELLAGQDVKMSSGDVAAITAALADGTLKRADLEVPAARVLRLVLKTRAFRDLASRTSAKL